MRIAARNHTAGATTRYEIDYEQWLEEGRSLKNTGFSAATIVDAQGNTPPVDITITNVSVTSSRLYFFVAGGTLNETFTVEVQITDTLNEVLLDTINFSVVAP